MFLKVREGVQFSDGVLSAVAVLDLARVAEEFPKISFSEFGRFLYAETANAAEEQF